MQTQAITTPAATVTEAAQPLVSHDTIAPIVAEQAAIVATAKAKQRAKREAKQPTAKPTSKPAKQSAKPVKPADTTQADKRAAASAAMQANADDCRAIAARFYAGASSVAHQRKPAKRDDYVSRAVNPIQRPANGVPSTRDESGLALILSRASKAGAFDPSAIVLDLGICSRLSSLGFISYDKPSDTFALTTAGATRARVVVKRAA